MRQVYSALALLLIVLAINSWLELRPHQIGWSRTTDWTNDAGEGGDSKSYYFGSASGRLYVGSSYADDAYPVDKPQPETFKESSSWHFCGGTAGPPAENSDWLPESCPTKWGWALLNSSESLSAHARESYKRSSFQTGRR